MRKNNVIHKYQLARLSEWIGDFEEAKKIYDEIEEVQTSFAKIVKPIVTFKKNNINMDTKINQPDLLSPEFRHVETLHKEQNALLFQPEDLKTKKFVNQNLIIPVKWRYSISTVSKSENAIRLEIRGFNPTDSEPRLNCDWNANTVDWKKESSGCEPAESKKADFVWFQFSRFAPKVDTYISIDRWGLLNGTAITVTENLGDALFCLNELISRLDMEVWGNQ